VQKYHLLAIVTSLFVLYLECRIDKTYQSSILAPKY